MFYITQKTLAISYITKMKNKQKSVLTICETFGNDSKNKNIYNCCCHFQEINVYEQKGRF